MASGAALTLMNWAFATSGTIAALLIIRRIVTKPRKEPASVLDAFNGRTHIGEYADYFVHDYGFRKHREMTEKEFLERNWLTG